MASDNEDAEVHQKSNKRQARREPVKLIAELKISEGPRFKVTVVDLSATGFRIETANHIPADKHIYLTIPDFQTLQGMVAWNDRETYGCAFRLPLHASVHAHLARRFPQLFK
jgi:hypothetical protein